MHCILPAFLWGAATGLQSKQVPYLGPPRHRCCTSRHGTACMDFAHSQNPGLRVATKCQGSNKGERKAVACKCRRLTDGDLVAAQLIIEVQRLQQLDQGILKWPDKEGPFPASHALSAYHK